MNNVHTIYQTGTADRTGASVQYKIFHLVHCSKEDDSIPQQRPLLPLRCWPPRNLHPEVIKSLIKEMTKNDQVIYVFLLQKNLCLPEFSSRP